LRNTDLDAKSYFSKERSVFQQNQCGGTLGGPLQRNKLFFFVDYQGQRTKQGQDTEVVTAVEGLTIPLAILLLSER
jgi:hypothetical protein